MTLFTAIKSLSHTIDALDQLKATNHPSLTDYLDDIDSVRNNASALLFVLDSLRDQGIQT